MDSQKRKKVLKKLFCLPPVPTLLISVPAYASVIYTLTAEDVSPAAAYVSYFLSAYALIITITGIAGMVRFVRQGIEKHPLAKKGAGHSCSEQVFKRRDVPGRNCSVSGIFYQPFICRNKNVFGNPLQVCVVYNAGSLLYPACRHAGFPAPLCEKKRKK